MNILLLAKKNPWPPKDGEAIAILQMAKGLAANGNSVTILYMNTPKHHFEASDIPASGKNNITFESVWVDSGIKSIPAFINLLKKTPYHVERFFSKTFLSKLIVLIQKEKFDIIQAEGLYLIQYFAFLKNYTQAKFIYRSHNQEGEIWKNLAANSKSPIKKKYLNQQSKKLIRYENDIVKNVDAIIPISLADTVHYKLLSEKNKVFYSPSGIDIENIPDSDNNIITNDLYFIGALDWLPNVEGLMWFMNKIFPAIIKLHPDVTFHIAGRNAPAQLATIKQTGIIFHGEVDNALDFITGKFICIVPVLSGSGMKLKIMEAMAAGKHVITTLKGAEGMPTGVDEHISIAVSELEFVKKLNDLIENKQQTAAKAKAGKHFVLQHLNNNTLTNQLTQFYSNL